MEKTSQNFKVRDEDGLGLSIIFNPPEVGHSVSLTRKSPYFQGFLSKQPSELICFPVARSGLASI